MHAASMKWRALQRRRETREAVFRATLERAPPEEQPQLEEALEALQAAQSLEVCNHFSCHGIEAESQPQAQEALHALPAAHCWR